MSRRIDVELTSTRADGTWTWRAAGAKEPKGEVSGALVPEGTAVGDLVKADADFLIDGIEILSILPAKAARAKPKLLEIFGTGSHESGVTTQLAPKRGRGRRDRGERGDRRGGRGKGDGDGGGRKDRADGKRGGRKRPRRDGASEEGDQRPRGDRPRGPRRDQRPAKPKAKRLRPKRVHRTAVLTDVPEEQRPIAEEVLRGGMPAVRKAIEAQNVGAREAGQPEINPAPLLEMAESLLPVLKAAEWRDRAEAAKASIDDVSLADLRSVVVAADGNTRSEEAKTLAEELRAGLTTRLEREQAEWLGELKTAVAEGRTVRALRLSSRPPKAGTPLPPTLLASLADQAATALAADVSPQRWGTVADAVSFSPVRSQVKPAGIPAEPGDELLATIRKISGRVPDIAKLFGVEPSGRRRPRPPKPPKPAKQPAPPPQPEPPVSRDEEE